MSNLPLAEFAQRLLHDGHAAVPALPAILEPAAEDQQQATAILCEAERVLRAAAPDTPPALNAAAALWALRVFAWAGYTALDRNQERTTLPDELSPSQPDATHLDSHWSVDVVFRFLPELCRRAERIAPEDKLHATLQTLAAQWPMSSVGMPIDWSVESLQMVMADDSLCRILVDRVTARADKRMAADETVQKTLRDDAGAYAEQLKLQDLLD
ncbi:hypothetical protein [Roseimaritima ulvae]|uniref:MoxR-vWA-beta-propeller ternary system domain-containing protein n=1 Tax=Roseimaritima ulvae TaxID=980254 RepID=A0A5B9R0R8_9BACT|nr:hypothetical protein [Roseimaritima ulvae]QEG39811.1 hypothetical protein UC8_18100 [Roseimaritima ulvae]